MRVKLEDLLKDRADCARIGERLKQITHEEAYRVVMESLKAGIVNQTFNTEPHETADRQYLYNLMRAVDEFEATINSFIFHAENYAASLSNDDTE